MKIKLTELTVQTRKDRELVDITSEVERAVAQSVVSAGLVWVMTKHTSSGILVTEGLPCLESDVLDHLGSLAPDFGDYHHNRYLEIDGRVAFNAPAHLKSVLTGYFAYFPVAGARSSRARGSGSTSPSSTARYCAVTPVQVIGE